MAQISPKPHTQSPLPSPTTSSTTSTTTNHPSITTTRTESNPYPTTFVQADTNSFKQVVQMLTGSSDTIKLATQTRPNNTINPNPIPPIKPKTKPSSSSSTTSRLYERRNSLKNNLRISTLLPNGLNLRNKGEILSPSMLDFPALALSPVTPLIPDPFNRSGWVEFGVERAAAIAEQKAIAEKGFYLHPSPTANRENEPRLLPLFPTTSPRAKVSGED